MGSEIEFSYLQTNGIRLHTALAGPSDGPLVILLHGFPEFWYGWRHQIAPLAQAGFRIAAPDQRGYNLSEVPRQVRAYRFAELSKDISGLLDALGRKDCYLAGHDWGAAVAWGVALNFPERVRKLAILNVPHPKVMLDYTKKHPRQMLKSWYIAFFQIPALADLLLRRDDYKPAAEMLRASSLPGTFGEQQIAEYKKAWKNSGGLTGMINWYRALRYFSEALPADIRLHMPVRILWGKRDIALTSEMADLSAQLCDHVELTYFENASHWVQHEAAEAVNQALIEFFGGS